MPVKGTNVVAALARECLGFGRKINRKSGSYHEQDRHTKVILLLKFISPFSAPYI